MAAVEAKSVTPTTSSVPSTTVSSSLPIYVAVEPRQLAFLDGSDTSSVVICVTNVCPLRVAFRVRTNAPTRYIVMPATGFLTSNESVNIRITNIEMKKYRRRHRFIVQAMEAKENDKDRKMIWNDARADDLDLVQCVRVTTVRVKKQCPKSTISSTSSRSPISPNAEAGGGGGGGAAAESPGPQLTDAEQRAKTEELNRQINEELETKTKEGQKLVKAVNEVKRAEVELDRASMQCKDLSNKIIFEENQQKIIKDKITKIDALLQSMNSEAN